MVQSKAATVDEYLAAVEPEREPALRRLRALCLEALPGWEERMQWGMPGYAPPGKDAAVSFNGQKNYISFYPGRAALEEHRGKLMGASFGGGCVRFANPDKIDYDAIAAMLRHAFANKG
jgi:uncharacterized protein YdhG (YjbR/CyaY superfamily)